MPEHKKSGVLRKVTLGLFVVVLGGAIAAPAVAAPPIGALKQFRIPTANSDPSNITRGSDGNYWFTESDAQAPFNFASAKQVGRITPAGVVTEFPVCNTCDNLSDIIQGPNNILYVTSNNRGLDKISTTNGAFLGHVEPSTGTALAGDLTIAGNDIYFNDFNDNSIWRFNVVTEAFTEFPVPGGSTPVDVTASGGFVYFAINANPGAIGRLDPSTGAVTEFPTDSGNATFSVATATDGTIWFTERFNGMVGKLDPGTGDVTEFATSSSVSQPANIAPAPGGTMWFTQFNVGNVVRITPAGVMTDGKTVKGSGPEGLVVSPDGMQIWYSLFNNNKIAMLSLR